VTSDPGPDSGDLPLPAARDGGPEPTLYDRTAPLNGQSEPWNGQSERQAATADNDRPGNAPAGQFNGQPAFGQPVYGPPAYGPPSYGPVPPYGPMAHGQAPYAPYGAPYGQAPYGQQAPHPGMLTATADRERTMDVLKAAYGEGRITKEEFDLRAGRTMSARTYAQLAAVVADLPAGPHLGVMPYQPGYYPAVSTPTSGLAIGALVCGIAEIFTLGFAAIPAVILGHCARASIKRTGERGDGMAVTGLVLGYLGIGLWALIIIGLAARS
jgi:hypothetical protein